MKALLILDLVIRDFAIFKAYIEKIPSVIQAHGGKYLVQGAEPEVIEGDWQPERIVVLQFPAKENAKAFSADPQAQELFKIRHQSTDGKLILVEACE